MQRLAPASALLIAALSVSAFAQAPGHAAISITTANSVGVAISGTTATDEITLRNLTIQGVATGGTGVSGGNLALAALFIENCHLTGVTNGVVSNFSSAAQVHISNTHIEAATFAVAAAGLGVHVQVTVDHCSIVGAAVFASHDTTIVASDTEVTGAAGGPAFEVANGGTLAMERCAATRSFVGVSTTNTTDIIRVADSIIANNTTGLRVGSGTALVSMGGNSLAGNGTDGSFTSTVAPQ